jgi:KDO2-lipid IV(A) lauroyltransferase
MLKKLVQFFTWAILYGLSLLPFWMLYGVADVVSFILYSLIGYRKKVIDENLSRAFPEKSVKERTKIRKEFYRYLSDLLVETIKLFTISREEVFKRVEMRNAAFIEQCFKNGQSVIGILGHYGNWEMTGLRYSQLFNEKRIIVYKPLSNQFFDNLLIGMRSRFGATLISMKNTMRKLVQYKNEPTMTVLVGDQTPAKSEITYFTDFLNQPTAVFLGVEKLAKLTNSVVIFCDIRRVKRGYYTCDLVPLFINPKLTGDYEITNRHVKYLEEVIREKPQYWLWSHRRWKYQPQDIPNVVTSTTIESTMKPVP